MKKQINYKYLNILLVLLIIYLLFLMRNLWTCALSKILSILTPFVIAFLIAYILYPILKFLESKKIPKVISVFLIVLMILLITGLTIYYVVPLFVNQLINLLSSLGEISKDIALKYNIDTKLFSDAISKFSSKVINGIGTYITNGTVFGFLSKSVDYLTKIIIISIVSIYFLCDMSKIRERTKMFLKKKKKKTYNLVVNIDKEITSYLKGLGIFMIIQFFEYTFLFLIIGHPNFLLLGVLACITTVIPYFGGLITNIIALLIASVVSTKLFVLTLIVTIVFPNIDGYIISPKIYGKTNKLPPLLTIFSVFAGGALFGFYGIIIAVPITIIILAIFNSYKFEINNKIKIVKKSVK